MFFTLLIAILLITFVGCRIKNGSYPFEQSLENVAKVEICQYDFETDSITPIVCLNENDYTSLLNDISKLDPWRPGVDMPQGYGKLIVYITYENNEAEMIGSVRSARVDANGKRHGKPYYFLSTEWHALLSKYEKTD